MRILPAKEIRIELDGKVWKAHAHILSPECIAYLAGKGEPMTKAQKQKNLIAELESARDAIGQLTSDKHVLERNEYLLKKKLAAAEEGLKVAKATIRTLVLGCEFKERGSIPEDIYGG